MFFYFNQAIKNYATFKGRTSRKAYWLYNLTVVIINFIIYIPMHFAPHYAPNSSQALQAAFGIWFFIFLCYLAVAN